MHERRPHRGGPFLALVVVLFTPAAARAQGGYLFLIRGQGSTEAFDETSGYAAAAVFPVRSWLSIQAEFGDREADFLRLGDACVNAKLEQGCEETSIRTVNSLRSIAVTALGTWQPNAIFQVMGGGGVSLARASSENDSPSGLQPLVFARKTEKGGLVGLAGVRLRPLEQLPVAALVQVELRQLELAGCRLVPRAGYTPFCGSARWTELKFGLGVSF